MAGATNEKMDCFVASAPLRKRFAFVAGNDEITMRVYCPHPEEPCEARRLEGCGPRCSEACARIPAARFARAMPETFRPEMRAWGMPGAQCTRSLVCEIGRENAHEYSQRSHRKSPGIPARNGFNGFLRALPGDRAFLPPSSALLSANLTPASGCQDHTTSPSAPVSTQAPRRSWYRSAAACAKAVQRHSSFDTAASTASRSNVRDDRDTPLKRDGMAGNMHVIWGVAQLRRAAARWHDGQITGVR
jgi:hypothetical protein